MKRSSQLLLLWCVLLVAATGAAWAKEDSAPKLAELKVSGLGWWRDRQMKINLELLLRDQRGPTLDANAIHDGALLLVTSLAEEGRLYPRVEISATPTAGGPVVWPYQDDTFPSLAETFAARKVEYRVERGKRFRIAGVSLEGLEAMTEKQGRGFFQDKSVYSGNPWRLPYSPGALSRMLKELTVSLRQLGHAEARAEVTDLQIDRTSGDVKARVRVTEGPKWVVRTLAVEGAEPASIPGSMVQPFIGLPWSATLEHDLTSQVRNACYRQGFPDATVQTRREKGVVNARVQPLDLKVEVKPGPQILVGEVRFAGAIRTRPSVLRSRVGVKPGALLDPGALDEARLDLARLDSFESVDLTYEPGEGDMRFPVFTIHESEPWESSVMAGYGSFEQLRVGLEVRHFNFLGYAGQGNLKLVQSQKSSRADLGYSFPQLFRRRITSTAEAYGLRRDEFLLERREIGLRLGFSRPLRLLGANISAGYTLERLEYVDLAQTVNGDAPSNAASGNTNAASIEFTVTRDRRDNVLIPHDGYRWFFQSEIADPSLGGSSAYQRFELGFTRHIPLASGLWLHAGFTHGAVATFGADDAELPVNKLFFPGGDNSIRGYGHGEAVPLSESGEYKGARSYAVLNVEAEFAVLRKLSVVIFSDSLGITDDFSHYPFDEELFSIGGGVRYQSIIGPIRLEYGYNLNPRPKDPNGTLLFSLGFPF